ncbi:hypothetical protein FH039_06885 [Thermococcus indicus]|uniref:Uncharacterized protein n=1 Tax=Thermococcus indicus TaxID=2586643 RepID=A0A4Y5SMS2_9EURY|nr:hypothetical protein [Thermococcus indicus]QDA31381.1 hypothetical protein FH039_06885 [Thermococcus indicus]
MAVLLGLLLLGVTAGSAMAMPFQKEPIKPQNQVGLGSVVMTRLESTSGAIIEKHRQYIGTGAGYAWYYKVKHNGRGYIDVSVFKWVPLGGYLTITIMPDMTTYSFNGHNFKLYSMKSFGVGNYRYKVVVANYDSWVSLGGWWTMGVKFDAGYGTHGIITLGMTEWPILDTILEKLGIKGRLTNKGKKLLEFVTKGSTSALVDIIGLLLSGYNVDVAIFKEV